MDRREAVRELLAALAATPLLARIGNAEALLEKGAATHAGATSGFLAPVALGTVASLADLILPRTDSPGAADTGVAPFIDRFVADAEPAFQEELLGDLARLDRLTLERHQVLFARASVSQRESLLRELDAADPRTEPAARGFQTLRILTVFAHYTSEAGQRDHGAVLRPGPYVGCTHPEHKK